MKHNSLSLDPWTWWWYYIWRRCAEIFAVFVFLLLRSWSTCCLVKHRPLSEWIFLSMFILRASFLALSWSRFSCWMRRYSHLSKITAFSWYWWDWHRCFDSFHAVNDPFLFCIGLLKEATGVYKERSCWTTSAFQILERCTMSRRSTSYLIICGQKAQRSPNIGSDVIYYRL